MTTPTTDTLMTLIQTELVQIKPDIPAISGDTDMVADLGLDSVQVLDMCAAIEDELDISIPVNRLGDVRTAGEMAALLSTLLVED